MNATKSRLGVWSEAGRLRRVLVCAPGLAHQRLTPENSSELLFDDVIWLQQARRDHFDFVAKMVDRGVEVLDLQELLSDVVAMPEARDWVLDRRVTDNLVGPGLTHEIRAWLSELGPDRLAEFLIGGVAYQDVLDEVGGLFLSAFSELDPAGFVIRPLPNTQFMRDNSAWIFRGVTLNPMYWPARRQETLLTTAVYNFHPAFADEKYDVWLGDPEGVARDHGVATLEGGDVMPIGKGVVVIGMGERSSHQAITQVARNLFAAGAAERVIIASLPKSRSAMHLDTVFTFCDHDLVTAFPPVVDGIVPACDEACGFQFLERSHDSASPSTGFSHECVDRRVARKVFIARPSAWTSGWSPPPATSTASSVSSGMTATTWSRSSPAWSSPTTATSSLTQRCARPASRSSPSTPASWAGAGVAVDV